MGIGAENKYRGGEIGKETTRQARGGEGDGLVGSDAGNT